MIVLPTIAEPGYKNISANLTHIILGVLISVLPPKSCGYLNIRKKYKCPTMIPRSSENPLQSDINREITRCGDLWLSEWKKTRTTKQSRGKSLMHSTIG